MFFHAKVVTLDISRSTTQRFSASNMLSVPQIHRQVDKIPARNLEDVDQFKPMFLI